MKDGDTLACCNPDTDAAGSLSLTYTKIRDVGNYRDLVIKDPSNKLAARAGAIYDSFRARDILWVAKQGALGQ